ncbi:MAG TPA: uracil-DNA glycosylase [Dehalococcoidia bacterium]|nr:uracil-DNA glycosylase [Dehalococcoidia bacterium]
MVATLDEKRTSLGELNAGVNACRACPLGTQRTRAVPGEGPVDAEIMLIGEAPGYYEDQQGRPFVGAAGQFLEQLLASIGLKRSDVFIANVIKCRPPANRDPLPEEIAACSGWLSHQLGIVSPKVVVTLGRYSMARFLPGNPISKIHGQGRKVNGLWIVPMYHPAAALHQGSLRRTIEEDFKKVPGYLEQARRETEQAQPVLATAAAAPQVEQMKLF